MRKSIMVAAVFCGVLIFAGKAYSQSLADQEGKIYYYYWDFSEANTPGMDYDQITAKVGEQYGVSSDQVEDIIKRGIVRPITAQEQSILDELWRDVNAGAGYYQEKTALCQKYGYSDGRMYELTRRQVALEDEQKKAQ